tara:strand:- start:50 stop:544 length:495 start_codon:yes stop_codon:yes gene_type:complete
MKKITSIIILFILLIFINSCAGYKPIFGSSNLQFEIADYSIGGDEKLGNQIYSKLYNFSRSNKNQEDITSIFITINVLKEKNATVKNSAGKILEYKISLNTTVKVKNYLTDDKILDSEFALSSSYKVQDQHSETIKFENKSTENLINQTYQELLIKLSENILLK